MCDSVFVAFAMAFLFPYLVWLSTDYLHYRRIIKRIQIFEKKIEEM